MSTCYGPATDETGITYCPRSLDDVTPDDCTTCRDDAGAAAGDRSREREVSEFNDAVDQAIDSGEWGKVLGTVMGAWFAADEGRFCQCAEPILVGEGLMCHRCMLENQSQRERVTKAHSSPHAYVVGRHDKYNMCDYCTRWRDDPIHQVLAVTP